MKKPILLIIDDEIGLARIMKLNLELTGEFQVEVAYTGDEGIKKASANAYDLVITDFRMPGGMDGRAVAEAIKRLKPHCPILLCTGDLEVDNQNPVAVDGIISKPIDHKSLHGIITEMLAKQD